MSTYESLVLHKTVRERFLSLETAECLVTYVWIDQTGENLKNKTRTLDEEPAGITVMEQVLGFQSWFGMEQEFALFHLDRGPFGWVQDGSEPEPVFGRDVSVCHHKACWYAGIKMFGTNSEDRPSQWIIRTRWQLEVPAQNIMSFQSKGLLLHKTVRDHYLALDSKDCLVTYVWISLTGEMKSKTRTFDQEPTAVADIPEWSAVWVDQGRSVEVYLVPVCLFRDPFLRDPNKLVLCEAVDINKSPAASNQRSKCAQLMKQAARFEPWFGMEQEFVLIDLDSRPYAWPANGFEPALVACGVGLNKIYGRDVSVCHYKACLYAGIKMFGTNAEALPSQWEFQVGPCEGIEMGDHLWMSRYILHRVCEDFGLVASLDVVPVKSSHLTSGCHVNFSTKEMRSEGGLRHIKEAIEKLSKRHHQHLQVYDPHQGRDNMSRLTSHATTSSFTHFSSAVAERNVSVRIPGLVSRSGCGYLEDRRPASNCDPYSVTSALVETCLLDGPEEEEEQLRDDDDEATEDQ